MKEVLINNDVNTNKNYIFGKNLNFSNINNNININNIIVNDEKDKNFINCTNSLIVSNNSYLEENASKIKVFKDNKKVYINSYWIHNRGKKTKSSKNSVNEKRSKYRDVSRNKNNWQVLLMMNKRKTYAGTYPSEEIAARVYDILSIKYRGLKARTNYIYNDDR